MPELLTNSHAYLQRRPLVADTQSNDRFPPQFEPFRHLGSVARTGLAA